MEMSKRIRTVVALVLVICILMPVTAYPLQYAPDSRRDIVLDGHPDPPIKAHATKPNAPIWRFSIPIFFNFGSIRLAVVLTEYGWMTTWQ